MKRKREDPQATGDRSSIDTSCVSQSRSIALFASREDGAHFGTPGGDFQLSFEGSETWR